MTVSRRSVIGGAGAWIASAAAHTGARVAATSPPDRPNIVFILVDDLDSALFEAALESLPAIKRIAREGATFTRFFASTPLCSPSRASMLRGQYAHNHGVLWNRNQPGGDGGFEAFFRQDRESSTFATWLHDAGYRTALIGKYLNGYPDGAAPGYVPPGWDHWAVHSSETRELFYFDYALNIDGDLTSYGDREDDYSTDVVSDLGVEFIQTHADSGAPFLLCLTPYAPHDPSLPAPRHAATPVGALDESPSFDEADVSDKPSWVQDIEPLSSQQQRLLKSGFEEHWRSLFAVDDLVDAVYSALGAANILESTYIVFASDNGFHFGEHRIPFGKATPYDESARIPLLMRGPGVKPNLSVDRIALEIDLAPTFAAWAGVEPPSFVDGRSLTPVLSGAAAVDWRNVALIQQFEDISVRTTRSGVTNQTRIRAEDGQLTTRLLQTPLPRFNAIRGEDMLYVEYETGDRECYDLESDPFALDNLASRLELAQLGELGEVVADLSACSAERCRSADLVPNAILDLASVEIATPFAGSS